jgi:proline iminopeptidase
LAKRWPSARFEIVSDAGHTATEPGLTDALVRATDSFAD